MPPPVSPEASAASPGGGKKKLKWFLIILAALLVIAGGVAAAYVGIIVPNKPENVLSKAVQNSLEAKQVTTKMVVEGSIASGSAEDSTAYKLELTSAANASSQAAQYNLKVTLSGATVSVEARYVDKNIYVKVGDLTTIAKLIETYSPDSTRLFNTVKDKLSNQWIVVDSTLLKQADATCYTDVKWGMTPEDVKLLQDLYGKHSFVAIKDTKTDTVNGKTLSKYDLSISNDQVTKFAQDKSLENLSIIKNLAKCDESITQDATDEVESDHKQTPITVWVDKSTKQIARLGYNYDKDGTVVDLTADFSYGAVNVTAPKGAKPALDVIADLSKETGGAIDIASLFAGSGSVSTKAGDTKRQTDLRSLQSQLEAYYAQNGYYPSLKDINSESWRNSNMKSLDSAALVDPKNSSGSKELKAAAQANFYAYIVTDSAGGTCEADSTTCAQYSLVATLSDGKPFKLQSLESGSVDGLDTDIE